MNKTILILILIINFANYSFSQTAKFITESISTKNEIKRLPNFDNLNILVVKKNGKPFKDVEISINGKKNGITNETGIFKKRIEKSGDINILFTRNIFKKNKKERKNHL